MNFWPTNGLHEKSKIMIYGKKTYVGWSVRASGRPRNPIFVENSHERPFSMTLMANTYGFLTNKCLHHKPKNVIYGKETYV